MARDLEARVYSRLRELGWCDERIAEWLRDIALTIEWKPRSPEWRYERTLEHVCALISGIKTDDSAEPWERPEYLVQLADDDARSAAATRVARAAPKAAKVYRAASSQQRRFLNGLRITEMAALYRPRRLPLPRRLQVRRPRRRTIRARARSPGREPDPPHVAREGRRC